MPIFRWLFGWLDRSAQRDQKEQARPSTHSQTKHRTEGPHPKTARTPTGGIDAQAQRLLTEQPSFADVVRTQSSKPKPDGWHCFRSEQRRFALWYPDDWQEHTEEVLIVKPTFARDIWESGGELVYSPGIRLSALNPPTTHNSEQLLSDFSRSLPEGFHKFIRLSAEPLDFRGCRAVCTRFLFTREDTTWIAFMLLVAGSKYHYVLDTSGRLPDVLRHESVLQQVLGTFTVF